MPPPPKCGIPISQWSESSHALGTSILQIAPPSQRTRNIFPTAPPTKVGPVKWTFLPCLLACDGTDTFIQSADPQCLFHVFLFNSFSPRRISIQPVWDILFVLYGTYKESDNVG